MPLSTTRRGGFFPCPFVEGARTAWTPACGQPRRAVGAGCQDGRVALPQAISLDDPASGLDPEQRAAVLAPRGPVCVLAGAGTGKTRTITRRIAHLVGAGQVQSGQVLAVTFTARAAGEMRTRLRELGVGGPGTPPVQARTFHAAALRQLRYFWPRVVGGAPWEVLEGKLRIVGQAAQRAGAPTTRESLRDLAGEIEWAKASLV